MATTTTSTTTMMLAGLTVALSLVAVVGAQDAANTTGSPCNARKVNGRDDKIVCVCNEQYCDKIDFQWPAKSGEAVLVETSLAGLRFSIKPLAEAEPAPEAGRLSQVTIEVDLSKKYQSILGWGGAFTDASGVNMHGLGPALGDKLLESYYGPEGLNYNLGRVPIAGSDFSPRAYTYDDSETPDYDLAKWSLQPEDHKYKIPYLKKAQQLARQGGHELKLFGSSWSPPAWMKANNKLVRGQLKDDNQTYTSYANYLVRFFRAYQEHGLDFWGATVQNEPVAAFLPIYFFNSLQFTVGNYAKFIGDYLGPALERDNKTKHNFKLMVGDDNLGFVNYLVPSVLEDPKVQKYVAGLAFHWYTNGMVPYSHLGWLYESAEPHIQFMLMTEACTGALPGDRGPDLGGWDRAQAYASDIIEDLHQHTSGWVDWNLALDLEGGPNWSKNFVDAPIKVDMSKNEIYKQPMYYVLAHFSRLFEPGSITVSTKVSTERSFLNIFSRNDISAAAIYNPASQQVVVNVLNKSKKKYAVKLDIVGASTQQKFVVDGKSLSSFVLKQ